MLTGGHSPSIVELAHILALAIVEDCYGARMLCAPDCSAHRDPILLTGTFTSLTLCPRPFSVMPTGVQTSEPQLKPVISDACKIFILKLSAELEDPSWGCMKALHVGGPSSFPGTLWSRSTKLRIVPRTVVVAQTFCFFPPKKPLRKTSPGLMYVFWKD